MADSRDLALVDCGEKLRSILAGRRRRRRRIAIAILIGCTAVPLTTATFWNPPTLLVWNASPSAPIGLYGLRSKTAVSRDDMVVAWAPEPVRSLAARRHYLPANVPLVKRVAAVAGDRVCAAGSAISINDRRVATRLRSDAAGRPMPWWSGCRHLRAGEYFLLMDHRQSFDGRYFGVTRGKDVIGRAQLLWAKPASGSDDG